MATASTDLPTGIVPVVVAGNSTVHAGRKSGRYPSGYPRYVKLCGYGRRDRHDPMLAGDSPVACKRCLASLDRRRASAQDEGMRQVQRQADQDVRVRADSGTTTPLPREGSGGQHPDGTRGIRARGSAVPGSGGRLAADPPSPCAGTGDHAPDQSCDECAESGDWVADIGADLPSPVDSGGRGPLDFMPPPIYSPPISEDVARYAQALATRALARGDFPLEGRGERGHRDLYAHVRTCMGRRHADYPGNSTLDDESISEGIVRALNAAD